MQILIIAGQPIGEYARGGQPRIPTPRLCRAAVVGIVLNVISRSRRERLVQTPVSLVLTTCVFLIAAAPASPAG